MRALSFRLMGASLLLMTSHAFSECDDRSTGSVMDLQWEVADAIDGSGKRMLPGDVRAEFDLPYGDDKLQRMDVYLPPGAPAGPVIVMVHGGAWKLGDKSSAAVVNNKVARWTKNGFVFVSINYRLSSHVDPLTQAEDVARALAYAQSQATRWGAEPSRVVLMGHSAGAHLVSLIAADPEIAKRQGAAPWLGTVALDSAALDLVKIMESRHWRFYDSVFGTDPNFWRQASPVHRLSQNGAPILLICSKERGESCSQANAFAQKGSQLRREVTVVPVALSHGQINSELGLEGKYTDTVESFLASLELGRNH